MVLRAEQWMGQGVLFSPSHTTVPIQTLTASSVGNYEDLYLVPTVIIIPRRALPPHYSQINPPRLLPSSKPTQKSPLHAKRAYNLSAQHAKLSII